jgi:hypothetical protein
MAPGWQDRGALHSEACPAPPLKPPAPPMSRLVPPTVLAAPDLQLRLTVTLHARVPVSF